MTKRVFILILLVGIAAVSLSVAADTPGLDWSPGMYWTYRTDALAGSTGVRTQGTLTFLVLGGDVCSTSEIWYLAAIPQWYDGTEIMVTTSHGGALTLSPWRRWPQIVNYIPPKHLPDFQIQFRQIVAAQGLPWGYSYDTSMRVETAREDGWSESIALEEIANEIVVMSSSSFDDATAVQYEWMSRIEGVENERVKGLAWWSPEVAWWVRAEGQDLSNGHVTRTYEIVLADWGVLSDEEMAVRLADALSSTEAIDPELADGLRTVLERMGVDVATN